MSKSLTLAYGDNLAGKTTFLSSALHYGLSQNPKFKARLVTCEDYSTLEAWIRAGILRVWRIDNRQQPFDTLILAAQGYWPDDPEDPNSKLRQDLTDDMSLFEGLATMSDYCMGGYVSGGLAARSGRGDRVGPAEETIQFVDGSSKVGGNPRTHYNVTQRWIHGCVVRSKSLPGHVLWTSHETVAKDDRSQKLICGPEVTGTAATATVPRWFGNTIHVVRIDTKVQKPGKETNLKSNYRLYLKPHYILDIPYPFKAVIRVPADVENMEDLEKIIPDFIPNNKDAFATLLDIRAKVDSISDKLITELQRRVS